MDDNTKVTICAAIDDENANLRALSLDIWNNPELCYKEHHAHKVLTHFLEERGFQVTKNYKLDTAFRASFSNDDDGDGEDCVHVGVLCEYDALPGIGHACGHNLIAIFGVAVGLAIKEAMEKSGVKGKLTVLGTPAEEGGGGKIDLIHQGAFDDLDIALMAHPEKTNKPKPINLALTSIDVEYEGKASHASSAPWDGVNAVDAAVLCYQNVSCMRQHIRPSWRVHGIFTEGGQQPNIIPQNASLRYSARAPTQKEVEELNQKLIGCFEGAAKATGCSVKYTIDPKSYESLMSNNIFASMYERHAKSLGIEFNQDPTVQQEIEGGSTDMGNVSRVLPSVHPIFALEPMESCHTKAFREIAGTESSHAITIAHAKAMAQAAVEVLQIPSLYQSIKEDFTASLQAGL